MAEPFGYGIYKSLMRRRGTKTFASPELYSRDPLRAFQIALGLKAGPLKEHYEERGMEIRKARRLMK